MKRLLKIVSLVLGLGPLFYWTAPSQSKPSALDEINKRGYILSQQSIEEVIPYP